MTDTKRVKARMLELGYTQVEVAKMLGISTAMFNRKLNNKNTFSAPQVQCMMHLLKLKNSDIMPYFFV